MNEPLIMKTVKWDNIKFYEEDTDSLDWKVIYCYLLLMAAATKVENEVEYLWKCGKVGLM
jgi:hypothetical protein